MTTPHAATITGSNQSCGADNERKGSANAGGGNAAMHPRVIPFRWSTVTGRDFARSITWARQWVNPLAKHIASARARDSATASRP